jgi:hypothetical protein
MTASTRSWAAGLLGCEARGANKRADTVVSVTAPPPPPPGSPAARRSWRRPRGPRQASAAAPSSRTQRWVSRTKAVSRATATRCGACGGGCTAIAAAGEWRASACRQRRAPRDRLENLLNLCENVAPCPCACSEFSCQPAFAHPASQPASHLAIAERRTQGILNGLPNGCAAKATRRSTAPQATTSGHLL